MTQLDEATHTLGREFSQCDCPLSEMANCERLADGGIRQHDAR